MGFVEIVGEARGLTRRQRWSHYLTLILALLGLGFGLNLRNQTLTATTVYVDTQVGIEVDYPKDWLLDTAGNYEFRVRDLSRLGFKTSMQVTVQPVNVEEPNGRNILDALSLARLQTLPAYNVGSIEPYTLPDETEGIAMNYTYVFTEPNPLLESVPIVVVGRDILAIKRGQAIIVTFRSDARTFEDDLPIFNRFLESLEF